MDPFYWKPSPAPRAAHDASSASSTSTRAARRRPGGAGARAVSSVTRRSRRRRAGRASAGTRARGERRSTANGNRRPWSFLVRAEPVLWTSAPDAGRRGRPRVADQNRVPGRGAVFTGLIAEPAMVAELANMYGAGCRASWTANVWRLEHRRRRPTRPLRRRLGDAGALHPYQLCAN